MNNAQIALIRLLARQAAKDYLHGNTAQLSEKRPIRTNRPVPTLAEKK